MQNVWKLCLCCVVLCFILNYDDNDVSEQLLSNTQKNCGIITNDLV